MKVLHTENREVYKYIHSNGTETAIKLLSNCDRGVSKQARDKYTVFVSSSYGCQMNCKFCMLHTKGTSYKPVDRVSTVANINEAIQNFTTEVPAAKEKALKLSWMSMGEPLLHREMVGVISQLIISHVLEEGLASSLDTIDIGTSLPSAISIADIRGLNDYLQRYHLYNKELKRLSSLDRPMVRFFVSLMSAVPETRNFLIPGSRDVIEKLSRLHHFLDGTGMIVHHLLLEDVNDSEKEIDAVVDLMATRLEDCEFRLLRYNHCNGSPFQESSKFDKIAKRLTRDLKKVKVQASPGSEIMAACGQFLVGEIDED